MRDKYLGSGRKSKRHSKKRYMQARTLELVFDREEGNALFYISKMIPSPQPRRFNVTGTCYPNKHYMADTSGKIAQIIKMIELGDYFTISRARQYGKTTTLSILEQELPKLGYTVARISFEGIGDTPFESEENFCQNIIDQIRRELEWRKLPEAAQWIDPSITTYKLLDVFLDKACAGKRIVLMIDETDKSSNNLVFLRFIGMLRDKYLIRDTKGATFHSVILVGVYDIKNLKLKMIHAGTHQLQDGEKRINSPWNIAVAFKVDMSLSVPEIASMLSEYENDYHTGMDIQAIAKEIRFYTSGYPFLCSRICLQIDEDLDRNWTIAGVQEAVKYILVEQNTLFDDLAKNIRNNDDLRQLLYDLVIQKGNISYNPYNAAIELGLTFGIIANNNGSLSVHNQIFEIFIGNYFITEQELAHNNDNTHDLRDEITENNKFNMALMLERFMQHYSELYSRRDAGFLERECRLLFLTYLKPIINGKGFYHIESETRDSRRMDVIIDYLSEQFIVELKLWYGEAYHQKALSQLSSYLSSKNYDTGYLLTFDFRKDEDSDSVSSEWIEFNGKRIFNCIVRRGGRTALFPKIAGLSLADGN